MAPCQGHARAVLPPPYGSFNRTALEAAGSASYRWTVLWDVDTRDWTQPGSSTIAARVLSETRPGSIVLMHFLPQTAAALPAILRGLRARRYKALPLDALFLVPGAQPVAGGLGVEVAREVIRHACCGRRRDPAAVR